MSAVLHPRGQFVLALALALAPACGDDEGPASDSAAHTATDDAPRWSDRLLEESVPELVAALGQGHAAAREAWGPHHVHTRAVFDLAPTTEGPPAPALDEPVVTAQHVEDELDLRWSAAAGEPVAFVLSQANDKERGRDVVVVGERVYVKKRHRAWQWYPLESDLWQGWLDDGWHAVKDAVELAAPRLAITAERRSGAGWAGGDAIALTLGRADQATADLVASGPTRTWRDEARIEGVEGTIMVDAATGLWMSAEVSVRYELDGADGRPLEGTLELTATTEPGAGAPVVAPPDAIPLRERTRYGVEGQRLLDGLAAP